MGNSIYRQEANTHKESVWGHLSDGRFQFSCSAMQGWRRSQEDAHITLPDFDLDNDIAMFAILDGHGGSAVSKVVSMKLPGMIKNEESYKRGDFAMALKEGFKSMDRYLNSDEGRLLVKEIATGGGYKGVNMGLNENVEAVRVDDPNALAWQGALDELGLDDDSLTDEEEDDDEEEEEESDTDSDENDDGEGESEDNDNSSDSVSEKESKSNEDDEKPKQSEKKDKLEEDNDKILEELLSDDKNIKTDEAEDKEYDLKSKDVKVSEVTASVAVSTSGLKKAPKASKSKSTTSKSKKSKKKSKNPEIIIPSTGRGTRTIPNLSQVLGDKIRERIQGIINEQKESGNGGENSSEESSENQQTGDVEMKDSVDNENENENVDGDLSHNIVKSSKSEDKENKENLNDNDTDVIKTSESQTKKGLKRIKSSDDKLNELDSSDSSKDLDQSESEFDALEAEGEGQGDQDGQNDYDNDSDEQDQYYDESSGLKRIDYENSPDVMGCTANVILIQIPRNRNLKTSELNNGNSDVKVVASSTSSQTQAVTDNQNVTSVKETDTTDVKAAVVNTDTDEKPETVLTSDADKEKDKESATPKETTITAVTPKGQSTTTSSNDINPPPNTAISTNSANGSDLDCCSQKTDMLPQIQPTDYRIPGARIWCANAGDSRSVLCRLNPVRGTAEAVPLSYDHKPHDQLEYLRIVRAGGTVNSEGRVDQNLNLSRAIGDLMYKRRVDLKPEEQKISGCPDVMEMDLQSTDSYILMGCDGVFEKLSNHQIVQWINKRFKERGNRKDYKNMYSMVNMNNRQQNKNKSLKKGKEKKEKKKNQIVNGTSDEDKKNHSESDSDHDNDNDSNNDPDDDDDLNDNFDHYDELELSIDIENSDGSSKNLVRDCEEALLIEDTVRYQAEYEMKNKDNQRINQEIENWYDDEDSSEVWLTDDEDEDDVREEKKKVFDEKRKERRMEKSKENQKRRITLKEEKEEKEDNPIEKLKELEKLEEDQEGKLKEGLEPGVKLTTSSSSTAAASSSGSNGKGDSVTKVGSVAAAVRQFEDKLNARASENQNNCNGKSVTPNGGKRQSPVLLSDCINNHDLTVTGAPESASDSDGFDKDEDLKKESYKTTETTVKDSNTDSVPVNKFSETDVEPIKETSDATIVPNSNAIVAKPPPPPEITVRRSKTPNVLTSVCEDFLNYNLAQSPFAEGGLGCDNMSILILQIPNRRTGESKESLKERVKVTNGMKVLNVNVNRKEVEQEVNEMIQANNNQTQSSQKEAGTKVNSGKSPITPDQRPGREIVHMLNTIVTNNHNHNVTNFSDVANESDYPKYYDGNRHQSENYDSDDEVFDDDYNQYREYNYHGSYHNSNDETHERDVDMNHDLNDQQQQQLYNADHEDYINYKYNNSTSSSEAVESVKPSDSSSSDSKALDQDSGTSDVNGVTGSSSGDGDANGTTTTVTAEVESSSDCNVKSDTTTATTSEAAPSTVTNGTGTEETAACVSEDYVEPPLKKTKLDSQEPQSAAAAVTTPTVVEP